MSRSKKVFAVHPGEILKTEFMEPPGVSAYALAKALGFPGIYEVIPGDRAISADPAVRLGKYFGLHRRTFGSTFRTTTTSGLQRAAESAERSNL